MRRVLAVVLLLWEPLTLALALSSLLARIVEHGTPAFLVLVMKVAVAGLGVAAGMALWQDRPGALTLARWALALSLATTVFARTSGFWPATLPPGVAAPALAASVAWTGGWLLWTFIGVRRC
jgi:hypothetical protein